MTVYRTYGQPMERLKIPAGYEAAAFRDVAPGDLFLTLRGDVVTCRCKSPNMPRLILQKVKGE